MKPNPVCWLLFAALALAGCGKSSGPTSAAPHALPEPPAVAACEPGQPGGRLVLAVAAPPRTFNPIYAPDAASDQVTRLLFAALAQFDFAKQQAVPALAEAWSVTPDHKTWTFELRRGLRWSDGHPLTSDDVVFTWNDVIYNPRNKTPLASVFRIGNRNFTVSQRDAVTVTVVTPEVFAPFVEFFGTVPVLPRHVLGDAAKRGNFAAAYGTDTPPGKVVGAGAFRLKEHRPGQFVVLERNPEFWATDRAGRRLPYLDELRLVATNPAPQFLAGQCDVCERIRAEDFAPLHAAAAQGRFRLVELGPGAERDFLWFNQNTNVNRISGTPFVAAHKLAWFRNAGFRQAVACALDRERIAREVFGGGAAPCETYLGPETARWNNPDVPRFSFNRERARTLLAQAGVQDRNGDGVAEDAGGRPCEVTLLTNLGNPARARIAAFMADDLRQIGVKLDVQLVPFAQLERKVNEEFTYEAAIMGLSGGGSDPASHLGVLRSDDPMHQWFPGELAPSTPWEARIDALMEAQMRTLDFAARKKTFDEVQAILGEQMPMIYTVTPVLHAAVRADLANLRPAVLSATPLTWNAEELYFKKP
jgi:peptide/nickel transport system substrate-binding protein